MSNNTEAAGSYDDAGMLQSFFRNGMTGPRAVLELFANSLDSYDDMEDAATPSQPVKRVVVFDITPKEIKLIDGANGMDRDTAKNLGALKRENRGGKARRGVSGFGAKAGTATASNKTRVVYLTRRPGGEYISIVFPWDKMYEQGKYVGMIEIRPMTEEEKVVYIQEREENGMMTTAGAHGTTVIFKYNTALNNVIRGNFTPILESNVKNPLDRIGVVFGKDNTKVMLNHHELTLPKQLHNYNYFGQPSNMYYLEPRVHSIVQYVHKDGEVRPGDTDSYRFITNINDTPHEITHKGRVRLSTKLEVADGLGDYRRVGEFQLKTACQVDTVIFNRDAPKEMADMNGHLGEYEKEHLGDTADSDTFRGCTKLVRNRQCTGLIPPPDARLSSNRGSEYSWFQGMIVQSELSYSPLSNQNNDQDRATNTQENKNQLDGSSITKKLTRMVYLLKNEAVKEIYEHFGNVLQRHAPPVVEEDKPLPVVEEKKDEKKQEKKQAPTVTHEEAPSSEEETLTASEEEPPQAEEEPPQAEEEPPQRHVVAAEVGGYRKFRVEAKELMYELQRVTATIQPENSYVDTEHIQLFNQLRKL